MRKGRSIFPRFLWMAVVCSCVFAGCGGGEEEQMEEVYLTEGEAADASFGEEGQASESDSQTDGEAGEEEEGASSDPGEGYIYVDVCGQVARPGVYRLPGGSRVFEAVEMAGGMTAEAEASAVNQAKELSDAEQVYVPSSEEVEENPALSQAQTESGSAEAAGGKVNINTATKEELMTLTGIGEVKADAIIRYRQEQGSFQKPEDLKNIDGIKDGVYQKVKDQITV